jgi:hypothetical protein
LKEHLSQRQLEEYSRQRLQAPELISVDDHLAVCADCRRRVEAALPGPVASLYDGLRAEAASLSESYDADGHLGFDQIAGYVDESLAPSERQFIADHLASCARCAREADDFRAFKTEPVSQPGRVPVAVSHATTRWWGRLRARFGVPSPAPAFGWALAALLLIILAGWLIRFARDRKSSELAERGATPTPSILLTPQPIQSPATPDIALVARLNDGGGQVTLDRQGELTGLGDLPASYQRMVKDALTSQRLARPSTLDELTRRSSSLMGTDEHGHQFSLTNPVGKVVLTDRPVFRWSPLDGAAGYVVEVYDGQFNLVAKSVEVTSTTWATTQPLARGQSYSWQVKAIKDGQQFQAPKPPAPQARFRVLDNQQADEIARARRAYGSSHLVLGLLYARAGLLGEAERELRALQTANPTSDVVRRLLASIRSQ